MKRGRIIAFLLMFMAAGCGADSASPKIVFEKTVQSGKLTACVDVPYEPFEFEESDKMKGIDIDLVKKIANELSLEASFRETDFDSIFTDLDNGLCDIGASAVSITPERQKNYLFSDGYFEISQSLMVKKADASTLSDLPSFSGKTIGVQKGTTGADYAITKSTNATITEFDDASDLTAALQSSQVDGVIQDFPINSYISKSSDSFTVVKTFTDVEREQYGFAMKKSSAELQVAINAALVELRDDGTYNEILKKYLGSAV